MYDIISLLPFDLKMYSRLIPRGNKYELKQRPGKYDLKIHFCFVYFVTDDTDSTLLLGSN